MTLVKIGVRLKNAKKVNSLTKTRSFMVSLSLNNIACWYQMLATKQKLIKKIPMLFPNCKYSLNASCCGNGSSNTMMVMIMAITASLNASIRSFNFFNCSFHPYSTCLPSMITTSMCFATRFFSGGSSM